MTEQVLERSHWVNRPLEEVFAFFENPGNLEKLTPSDLGFEILSPQPIAMKAGAVIDYRVRPFGFPLRWRTLIESYDPPRSFTDLQQKGPYAFWHHTHRFESENGGTRMTDVVRYRLPFGALGLLALPLVRRELKKIFDYREKVIAAVFGPRGDHTMKIVIAGGSGFIGRHLTAALREKGYEVSILTRGGKAPEGARAVSWDGRGGGEWEKAVADCDAVINLCGAGVADRPWTASRRQVLVDSRLEPTRALVEAMRRGASRPKVFVNASAVGIYGDSGERSLGEDAAAGEGFLADLCKRWEAEASKAGDLGVRVVLARIGVVLGRDGGALPRMLPPFKLGVGGRLGPGTQAMPWVHVADAAGLLAEAVTNVKLSGAVNVVAPGAATNAQFTKALGAVLGRPTIFPVPAFVLKTLLGEMSGILLASQKVVPTAAGAAGYKFKFADVEGALRAAVR